MITGTSGSLSHNTSVSLVVNPPPSFSLSATPSSQTVLAGGTGASYNVTLTPGNGFTGTVSFNVSGLPTSASASFSPSSLTTSGSTTLSISTSLSTPAGTYPFTITGSSGQVSSTTSVTLVVTENFAVSVSPSSETIAQKNSGTYTVTVTASPGFAGTVSLSATGLPARTTANFNPNSVANSGSSTLTVQVSPKAPPGTYTFTTTGTGGGLVRSTNAILAVQ
jgi:hypothetical protein